VNTLQPSGWRKSANASGPASIASSRLEVLEGVVTRGLWLEERRLDEGRHGRAQDDDVKRIA
jgi:hypothetical protein